MGKYSDIVETPWREIVLFPESIPHLLHWDLAYLWILEKQPDLRPQQWEARIEAWRYLVASLLTGELELVPENIEQPLIDFARPLGITTISWVRLRTESEQIGVLSPTVLVRPLPDFKSDDLNRWKRIARDPRENRPDELAYFVGLTIDDLKRDKLENSFPFRLARILEREFFPRRESGHRGRSRSVSIPMLRQLVWTPDPDRGCIDSIELLVREPTDGQVNSYVPRCNQCGSLLTKERDHDAIKVESDRFEIQCAGGHKNTLNLSDFLIWYRKSKDQVIVWDSASVLSVPEKGVPPEPEIKGVVIQFEWDPVQLGGERKKRFLKLLFPQMEITKRKINEVFFKTLVVPGIFERFSGLPVRPDWLDVLENPHDVEIERDTSSQKIVYKHIRLKGWPEPIIWSFPRSSVQRVPELGVGIYPDPRYVPETWKWYRCFLHGSRKGEYRIRMDGDPILPWLVEVRKGHPESFSVVSQSDGSTGVTYWQKERTVRRTESHMEIRLGIDFGTTNTIIYFQTPEEIGKDPTPDQHGLKPSELASVVRWVAEVEDIETTERIGDFLPGHQYSGGWRDQYVIPSAIWEFDGRYLIRWGPDKPVAKARPHIGFKWDVRGKDYRSMRKAYLEEIILMGLPSIFKKADLRSTDITVHMGFAFPLAFDYQAREGMKKLLEELEGHLWELTGLGFESYSINESQACVRAFGVFNPGETFLVADMGGATMDLAFFTFEEGQSIDMHQIGSIRFAGESYVQSLSEKKKPDRERQAQFQWELRDLIVQGECHEKYGQDQDSQTILRRFTGLAFEYLRTMVAAFQREYPERRINLVLVGNGWHLVEAFTRETRTRGPQRVFQEYYNDLLERLSETRLRLRDPLPSLPSPKHLVVIGALKNITGSQKKRELEKEPDLSKLPAGRAMRFRCGPKEVAWYELVGEGIPWEGFSQEDLRNEGLDILFDEMAPLDGRWKEHLLDIFEVDDEHRIPYPPEPTLREKIINAIQGTPPKLSKGPLQIILETYWVERLKK